MHNNFYYFLDEREAPKYLIEKCMGARLTFTGQFRFFDGDTLVDFTSDIDKGNHYEFEDEAFIKSVETGVPNQGYISKVINVAKLLDTIYQSAEEGKEIRL